MSGGFQETIGDELVDGFEIGISGNLSERWTMFGSYAFLDSEIVDDGPVGTERRQRVPEHTAQ